MDHAIEHQTGTASEADALPPKRARPDIDPEGNESDVALKTRRVASSTDDLPPKESEYPLQLLLGNLPWALPHVSLRLPCCSLIEGKVTEAGGSDIVSHAVHAAPRIQNSYDSGVMVLYRPRADDDSAGRQGCRRGDLRPSPSIFGALRLRRTQTIILVEQFKPKSVVWTVGEQPEDDDVASFKTRQYKYIHDPVDIDFDEEPDLVNGEPAPQMTKKKSKAQLKEKIKSKVDCRYWHKDMQAMYTTLFGVVYTNEGRKVERTAVADPPLTLAGALTPAVDKGMQHHSCVELRCPRYVD